MMPLQCNIDAKGKVVRLIYGVVLLVAGILTLVFWAIPASSAVSWIVSLVLILVGVFSIFEARVGWCAIRAMGFKTPV